jgi:hypothetical protein
MIQNFDYFNQLDPPDFILCNPDKSELFSLGTVYDKKLSLRYNSLSELSFVAPAKLWVNPRTRKIEGFQKAAFQADAYQVDNLDQLTITTTEYYDYLVSKRLIYIPDVGYFMITGCEETDDGIAKEKKIVAQSLEVQLTTKYLTNFSGTYQFYDALNPSDTLLGIILTYLPGWTAGDIDSDLLILYRTFDISSSTIYSFLMNDVEEAYQCVFNFDYLNQTINAYTIAGATSTTDIYMSFDNLIEKIDISEIADELVTALSVYGGGDLSINQVNPLGTDTIYDLSYFKTTVWMTQALIDAIDNWEDLIIANQAEYANLLTSLLTYNDDLINKNS